MPGSFKICTAVASPIFFQSCKTHTTFLSRVTSINCGPLKACPREVKIVLPFASRVQVCGAEVNWYSAGRSVLQLNSHSVSLLLFTSRVSQSFSSVMSVLPFFNLIADQGFGVL